MSKLIISGNPLPNMPWEDRPEGSNAVMWRFSKNPIIPRDLLPTSNSIFNSAVVPFGEGFAGVTARGSEQNDAFVPNGHGGVTTRTNHSGGIQGGLSNGQDIFFRVAFKPVATILQSQQTVNRQGEAVTFKAQGRHDPCVLPRAVPVVEAMAAMTLLDHYLLDKASRL